MNVFLGLAFLFFIGSVLGWFLELIFRRFFSSANPERKWINPGFLVSRICRCTARGFACSIFWPRCKTTA